MLSGVEVVPSALTGEIDAPVACLVVAYGACHECWTEHPLVFDVQDLAVAAPIHDEGAHHGVVLQMYPSCHGVEVWHESVAELVVPDDALVGWKGVGGYVPHLAQGPLAVCAVEGHEASELIPACLQLTPFLHVLIFHSCLAEDVLCLHVTALDAEASLILSPEGKAGEGVVHACCHLCAHVFPSCAYVAAPCGCAVAL